MSAMSDLAVDPRSASAYTSFVDRSRIDPDVGLLSPRHLSASALLRMLHVGEGLDWLSLAYEVTDRPEVTWWLVGLTRGRLLGASLDPAPRVWSHQRGAWQVSLAGSDVVLSLGQGAPLRVRGTSPSVAAQLFGWTAPAPESPEVTEKAYVDPALDDEDDLQAPQLLVHSWKVAEELAGWHMKELGFADVALTAAGADGGIDVAADSAAAQVKHYARAPVGAPAVQQLRGAAVGKDWALFYSLSGYTKSAVDYANAATVALFQYDENGLVEPRNDAATHLVESRTPEGPPDASEFERERNAKALMQEYFEATSTMFFEVANRGLQRATPGSPLLAAIRVELSRVEAIVRDLGGHTYPISQAMDRVDQIIEATRRLDADVSRLG